MLAGIALCGSGVARLVACDESSSDHFHADESLAEKDPLRDADR